MAANTRRGIVAGLTLGGVDLAQRAPPVLETIQPVYILDDLSLLFPPLRRPQFYMTEVSPSSAVRRGFIEISPPPDSAIIVPWVRNDDAFNQLVYGVADVTQITNDLATVGPDISLGGTSRALVQEGTGGVPAGLRLALGEQWPPNQPPMVLRPGQILFFGANALNLSVSITMAWREIPIAAPSTPS